MGGLEGKENPMPSLVALFIGVNITMVVFGFSAGFAASELKRRARHAR